jgi:hypothetical protein
MRDLLTGGLNLWNRFRDYVTVGLLGLTLVTGAGWYVTDLKLEACEANTEAIVESTRAAAAEATTIALEDKQRIEQEYRDYAAEQTEAYNDLLGSYNASLVRYANRGTTSRPPASAPSGSPGSPASPGESPDVLDDVILIPFSDAEICAENTARLQVAREWALGLNEIE